MCFRSVVLLYSADEGSEKRVLRCACFSEIMRTLLIGRGESATRWHAHKNSCFDKSHSAAPLWFHMCWYECVVCACVCCFAFLHVGKDTLFCLNARISTSNPITVILCQLSRIILWGFSTVGVYLRVLSLNQGPSFPLVCMVHSFFRLVQVKRGAIN